MLWRSDSMSRSNHWSNRFSAVSTAQDIPRKANQQVNRCNKAAKAPLASQNHPASALVLLQPAADQPRANTHGWVSRQALLAPHTRHSPPLPLSPSYSPLSRTHSFSFICTNRFTSDSHLSCSCCICGSTKVLILRLSRAVMPSRHAR